MAIAVLLTTLVLAPLDAVAQATSATLVPQTGFEIDGNRPFDGVQDGDRDTGYGPGLTPGGNTTTGVYYNHVNDDPCGLDAEIRV